MVAKMDRMTIDMFKKQIKVLQDRCTELGEEVGSIKLPVNAAGKEMAQAFIALGTALKRLREASIRLEACKDPMEGQESMFPEKEENTSPGLLGDGAQVIDGEEAPSEEKTDEESEKTSGEPAPEPVDK